MNPLGPQWNYLQTVLNCHLARLRAARRDGERGASAVEFAIITGVVVVIIAALVIVIKGVIGKAEGNIQTTVNP
ncbi:MAG: hypothetical protein ABSA93_32915 [Streptosporangiaceae bacterium]|jgi:Flp pilus assembly pilin Flp